MTEVKYTPHRAWLRHSRYGKVLESEVWQLQEGRGFWQWYIGCEIERVRWRWGIRSVRIWWWRVSLQWFAFRDRPEFANPCKVVRRVISGEGDWSASHHVYGGMEEFGKRALYCSTLNIPKMNNKSLHLYRSIVWNLNFNPKMALQEPCNATKCSISVRVKIVNFDVTKPQSL